VTPRILVTRARAQAKPLEAALREHQLDPIAVPTIAVEIDLPGGALDSVVRAIHTFDWVVVTSPNGARAILTAAERLFTSLRPPNWAAIGAGTAEILEREDVQVSFLPSRAEARALADELPIHRGEAVLLLRGDLAGDDLPRRLEDRGAVVDEVIAYRTIEGPSASGRILDDALAAGRPDAVVFASGSAVRGLVAVADAIGRDVRSIPAICIGPDTCREATRHGFHVLATSTAPDAATIAATAAAALAHPVETA
jgi:uroporphyrinogen-III synthase